MNELELLQQIYDKLYWVSWQIVGLNIFLGAILGAMLGRLGSGYH